MLSGFIHTCIFTYMYMCICTFRSDVINTSSEQRDTEDSHINAR